MKRVLPIALLLVAGWSWFCVRAVAEDRACLYTCMRTNGLSEGQSVRVSGSHLLRDAVGEILNSLQISTRDSYFGSLTNVTTNYTAIVVAASASSRTYGGDLTLQCTQGSIRVEDLLDVVAKGYDSYLLKDENLLIFTAASHYEKKVTIILQGKAQYAGSAKPVTKLDIVPLGSMGKRCVSLDTNGTYLCAFEVYLTAERFRLGAHYYDYRINSFEEEYPSILWLVDGSKTVKMSSSNILINAVNFVDVVADPATTPPPAPQPPVIAPPLMTSE
jgi:hypothetical protein